MLKGGAPGRNFGSRVLAGTFALTLAAGYGLMQARVADASSFCSSNTINAVWVTITEIDAHIAKQKGFQTLATGGPTQINLLAPNDGTSPGSCMLGALGDIDGLPPGKYGQVRIILANNGGSHGNKPGAPNLASNACQTPGGLAHDVVNCVEFTPNGGSPTFAPLDVGSASNTGLKVPPGQVGQGGLTVTQGELLDLLVTMDPCSGLVATGFGKGKGKGNSAKKFKLKPTLHRGELSLVPFIAGTVVEGTVSSGSVTASGTPVPNASVWLEDTAVKTSFAEGDPTPNASIVPVYNVLAKTVTTDPNGNFEFCPVTTTDLLEIVAISATMPSGPRPSDVTLTTGVQTAGTGVNGIVIPLVEPASAPTANAQYTTETGTSTAIGETLDLGIGQSDGTTTANTPNEAPFDFANAGAVSPAITAPSGGGCTCPAGTDCACVALDVPPDNPVIGPAKGSYTQAAGTGEFSLLANTSAASGPGSCSPDLMATAASSTVTKPTLSFQNCQ